MARTGDKTIKLAAKTIPGSSQEPVRRQRLFTKINKISNDRRLGARTDILSGRGMRPAFRASAVAALPHNAAARAAPANFVGSVDVARPEARRAFRRQR